MGKRVGQVYLEIGGGGVEFVVSEDSKGRPVLEVNASNYGQKTNGIGLLTNAETLRRLGEMLVTASQHEFSGQEYVYAAKIDDRDYSAAEGVEVGSQS
jgi:hypothetical protein